MKLYYNGNYKIIDDFKKEIIYKNIKDIPDYNTEITEIEIESGTSIIKKDAFSACESLKKITIPDSVTKIEEYAFYDCVALESIKLPKNITKIDKGLFGSCKSLSEITIPEFITEIEEYAFCNCTSLSEIKLPKNITKIGANTFANCKTLNKINLPNSITEIEEGAFYGCKLLKEINLPKEIKKINKNTFGYCHSLKSLEIPKSVTKINELAFYACISLKEINIPEKITTINIGTFKYCESLETIKIPKNIEKIEGEAFGYCHSLKNIIFEDNPNLYIHYKAFDECENLDDKIKEKIICKIAKNINLNEKIPEIIQLYDVQDNSELIQELMSINIGFFNIANNVDKEVFLDAALDSINNIYEKDGDTIIETDLCNIRKRMDDNNYDIIVDNTFLNDNKFIQRYNKKIKKAIEDYRKQARLEKNER